MTHKQTFHHDLLISVSPTDTVLHTIREKEKPYTPDQSDPEVVQPYAAYSPAGHVKVKSYSLTHQALNLTYKCKSLKIKLKTHQLYYI